MQQTDSPHVMTPFNEAAAFHRGQLDKVKAAKTAEIAPSMRPRRFTADNGVAVHAVPMELELLQ